MTRYGRGIDAGQHRVFGYRLPKAMAGISADGYETQVSSLTGLCAYTLLESIAFFTLSDD